MKKISLVGMFATAFLVSCVLGALISRCMLQSAMAVKVGGKSAKLQLQFRNGTPITSYSWGEFLEGQTKRLDCQLAYTGKKPVDVMWNTTGFPFGWRIKVRLELEPKRKWWSEGITILFVSRETRLIQIVLEEVNGVLGQSESFTLNFIGLGEAKKTH